MADTVSRQLVASFLYGMENPRNYLGLSFAPGKSGPSIGPVQLDAGTPGGSGVSPLNNIMRNAGYTDAMVSAVDTAAYNSTLVSNPNDKVAVFQNTIATELAPGVPLSQSSSMGYAVFQNLNYLVRQNSAYVYSVSSNAVDEVADKIDNFIANVQSSGRPLGVLDSSSTDYKQAIGALAEWYNQTPRGFYSVTNGILTAIIQGW